jgi:hypothetical protein
MVNWLCARHALNIDTTWKLVLAPRPGRFTFWERAHCTHYIGSYVFSEQDFNLLRSKRFNQITPPQSNRYPK